MRPRLDISINRLSALYIGMLFSTYCYKFFTFSNDYFSCPSFAAVGGQSIGIRNACLHILENSNN